MLRAPLNLMVNHHIPCQNCINWGILTIFRSQPIWALSTKSAVTRLCSFCGSDLNVEFSIFIGWVFLGKFRNSPENPICWGKPNGFHAASRCRSYLPLGVSARSFSCANHKPPVGQWGWFMMVYHIFFPSKIIRPVTGHFVFFSGFLMSRTWLRFDLAFLVTFFQQRKKCGSQKLSIEVRHLAFGTCDDVNCEVIHHKMLRV